MTKVTFLEIYRECKDIILKHKHDAITSKISKNDADIVDKVIEKSKITNSKCMFTLRLDDEYKKGTRFILELHA